MRSAYETIEAAIHEASSARARVSKVKTNQVRGVDDIGPLKATAQTWFHTHRPVLAAGAPQLDLSTVDECYQRVLDATARHSAKSTYILALKGAKVALIGVRATALTSGNSQTTISDDLPPDFSPLAGP